MNLQKKLIQLSEYKCSFKYVDSYFLISVIYPNQWSIIPSEDNTIEVGEENGTTFYAAPIETDIECAFDLIDETIAYNLDVEKKMSLLKYNIGKLQEIFATKDLDELETIEFVFKKKKTEKASSVTKKNKPTKDSASKQSRKKTVQEKKPKQEPKPIEEELVETHYENDAIYDTNEGEVFTVYYPSENDVAMNKCDSKVTEKKYLEEVKR